MNHAKYPPSSALEFQPVSAYDCINVICWAGRTNKPAFALWLSPGRRIKRTPLLESRSFTYAIAEYIEAVTVDGIKKARIAGLFV
jgi:hypothetical protein